MERKKALEYVQFDILGLFSSSVYPEVFRSSLITGIDNKRKNYASFDFELRILLQLELLDHSKTDHSVL